VTTTENLSALAQSVSIKTLHGDKPAPWGGDVKRSATACPPPNHYRVTLGYAGRTYTFDFWRGTGIKDDPTALGCLECLLDDANGSDCTFDEWCADRGYDSDSRTAERTFKACRRVDRNLRRLLGDDFGRFIDAARN
jgi:hypothetical protein